MNWKDFLTDQDRDELARIEADKVAGQRQSRRIYDRCRKRMLLRTKPEMANEMENTPEK